MSATAPSYTDDLIPRWSLLGTETKLHSTTSKQCKCFNVQTSTSHRVKQNCTFRSFFAVHVLFWTVTESGKRHQAILLLTADITVILALRGQILWPIPQKFLLIIQTKIHLKNLILFFKVTKNTKNCIGIIFINRISLPYLLYMEVILRNYPFAVHKNSIFCVKWKSIFVRQNEILSFPLPLTILSLAQQSKVFKIHLAKTLIITNVKVSFK